MLYTVRWTTAPEGYETWMLEHPTEGDIDLVRCSYYGQPEADDAMKYIRKMLEVCLEMDEFPPGTKFKVVRKGGTVEEGVA